MSKQLRVVIAFTVPFDGLVGEEEFKTEFDGDESKLERFLTESEGIGIWFEYPAIIQDVSIVDDSEPIKTTAAGNSQTPQGGN